MFEYKINIECVVGDWLATPTMIIILYMIVMAKGQVEMDGWLFPPDDDIITGILFIER